jgi:AcrR family transcriptional regulator
VSASARTQTPQGDRTRRAILARAVDLASAEGLEGLTIGRLASELSLSKSGLIGHFGSKEELQLATIDAAREIFFQRAVAPALAEPEGLPRLRALCDHWLSYAHAETFRGGCFFSAASSEFDGRPGPVRDRIATVLREWLDGLEAAIADAQRLHHLRADVDAKQLAFELHALEMAANWAFQLFGDREAPERARRGIIARIEAAATPR